MELIKWDGILKEVFPNGATYQTIVGDNNNSTPIRIGIQISPPGYNTGTHSHPYMEVVSVLEGAAEVWTENVEGVRVVGPGSSLIFHPNEKHGFRAIGNSVLKTYGVHASSERIVVRVS